ncbi:carboxypeptidase-like regulatory domain-containing protein [Lutibacter sp.]|uniref:carboxypeptidase-like regulatory domain-containing protein n=1 Tax=Lutibacter sp. TaxID=1925666 RepID=UPI0025C69760|nr:carboxypeptidase-like regulatory domain-containing protein [Lutibacter sp.]MCF6168435.1 carboxypeptidase-like regulatory domain-containing protein [Lutibacter sp.]
MKNIIDMKKWQTFVLLPILFCWFNSHAQNYQATLKDYDSKEVIPFASILFATNNGVITNEDGKFSLNLSEIKQDSIYISSVGYLKKGFAINTLKDSVLYLKSAIENLDLVYVSKENYTANDIINLVEDNMALNYKTSFTNQKIFYRSSFTSKIYKFNTKIKKSSIPEIDQKLLDSIQGLIPKNMASHLEVLGNYYTNGKTPKLTVTKAAKLYNKKINHSIKGMSEIFEKLLTQNTKPNSYLKVKSGIFSSKVQVDSILSNSEKAKGLEKKIKDSLGDNSPKNNLINVKYGIRNLYKSLFYAEDPTFNLIDKKNRYNYTLNGYTLVNDEPCYIINFNPKGKKKFKGTLYINVNDFAIVQMDYTNVKPLKSFSLFGISFSQHLYTSKVLFRKKGNYYLPYFIQLSRGDKFRIKRPLTIIEKNKYVKGRRKQNEVAMNMEFQMEQVYSKQFFVYETSKISENDFNNLKENKKYKATYLPKYDPLFWAKENIVAPNTAIQNFTTKN